MNDHKKYFQNGLFIWNKQHNNRPMPWKAEKDPYKIWLSEIILQQTRVEQGWDYYNRFVLNFPDIKKLAAAPEQKVFKLWEGLGYYTRCKNLIATANYIAKEKQGKFPDKYADILNLKGIGPYTAAAIASFAYNLPHAVVDGNVFRVLSRFFGIDIPVDSTHGKEVFTELAETLLDKKHPGIYNQAIMDFGAVVCKPKNPACAACPLKARCAAYLEDRVGVLPLKAGKMIKKHRWFNYFIIEYRKKIYVRKRAAKGIWENLYEFVLLETDKAFAVDEMKDSMFMKQITPDGKPAELHRSKLYKQQLTHQTIHGNFIQLAVKSKPYLSDYEAVTLKQLVKLPFPRLITAYLAENELKAFER